MSEENEDPVDQQAMADEWAAAMEEQAAAESTEKKEEEPDIEIEKFAAKPINESKGYIQGDVNLDVVLDIPVTIAMEIGRTKISIRNLLQLNQGSVVELDRLAGEPMDVMVNGTLVAHGEVVVVNEKFGIRLTDVISPSERIKNLK